MAFVSIDSISISFSRLAGCATAESLDPSRCIDGGGLLLAENKRTASTFHRGIVDHLQSLPLLEHGNRMAECTPTNNLTQFAHFSLFIVKFRRRNAALQSRKSRRPM